MHEAFELLPVFTFTIPRLAESCRELLSCGVVLAW